MNMRSFWWLALAFTLLWIWLQWTQFQNPQTQAPTTATQSTSQTAADATVPEVNEADAVPGAHQATQDVPTAKAKIQQAQRITVKTDVLDIVIDTQGGDIRDVKLLKYAATKDHSQPFQLMGDEAPMMYIAQNGIALQKKATLPAPTHKSLYQSAQTHYELTGDTLEVPLTWEQDGVKVTKIYRFQKGRYLINIDYRVENQAQTEWSGSLYSQLVRNTYDPDHNAMMYTYTGPVLYNGHAESKYNKHPFDDLNTEPVNNLSVEGGWAAMIQHYFMSAVIPNQEGQNRYYAKPLGEGDYVAGVVEPMVSVEPGQTGNLTSELYIGPIIQDNLEKIAPGLELTVDYGVLTIIAEPIFWVLEKIHALVGNWGWSIILLTILIKLLFYKLSETSYRSMARLKKFQPKLQQLKENYGDDKAIFQQKLMKLYKEEKINPLGGCLPILVQMPVFIALYWVLLYSAEMRQAPWILWIQDLSAKDPYYILPVLMGISMWVQQKLNPSAMMDEMQQKVMKALPFIFTIFFMFFPAGLVLYWVVNNILSVAQQWYITKKIESGEEK
ncbi:membrane protein insertase YidC [Hydrogenovibrio thermophilus]|jgi:YidC/Oxa1 family membrane protein insertase|uniref:Membrane protein insertase YidC n=1 Tax=Hydrogenovibrio thermophilus TaxID=265883 RepID=A0A410H608_9GAMM|nr:membrane protein insertase YidC [Hydrogenovibrio thermophilus]QAB16363.1 membrane protein insertase YidC [Hydrogenovibrio thermophilus]